MGSRRLFVRPTSISHYNHVSALKMANPYLEPPSRYDTISTTSTGVSTTTSTLPPASIVASSNPSLFSPASSPVYNTNDGNTYVFNGTNWAVLSSSTEPVVAHDMTIRITPETTGKFRGLVGQGVVVTHINGVAVTPGSVVPLIAPSYYVLHSDQSITFNPAEFYDRLTIGDEVLISRPYTISDGITSSTANLTTIIERPVAALPLYNQTMNSIYKLDFDAAGSDYELSTYVKTMSGPNTTSNNELIVRPTSVDLPVAAENDVSCLMYNPGDGRFYIMRRDSAASRTLCATSMGVDRTINVVPLIGESLLSVGNVGSPVDRVTSASAIDANAGVAFLCNTTAAGTVDFACVVTMPGYKANTIPGIYGPGIVIPVRTNNAGATALMNNLIGNAMTWSPKTNRFYSVAPSGAPLINGVGTTIGAAGSFFLIEHRLDYGTYNPTDPTPYVGYTSTVFALTMPPAQIPSNSGQLVIGLSVDGNNDMYMFTRDSSPIISNIMVNRLNLSYLSSLATTNSTYRRIAASVIGGSNRSNQVTCNPYAPSQIESPELSLGANLPLTTLSVANYYTTYQLGGPAIPIRNPAVAINFVQAPFSLAGTATSIRSINIEYVNYPTTIVTSAVVPSPLVLSISTFGNRIRRTYTGPTNELRFVNLLNSTTFSTTYPSENEVEIDIWLVGANGIRSAVRTVYINIAPAP